MTTRLTPPRPVLGQWLVDEQVWISSDEPAVSGRNPGDWLLVETRFWFRDIYDAWNFYNFPDSQMTPAKWSMDR